MEEKEKKNSKGGAIVLTNFQKVGWKKRKKTLDGKKRKTVTWSS